MARTEGVLVLEQYFGDYITVAVFIAAGAILVGISLMVVSYIIAVIRNYPKEES